MRRIYRLRALSLAATAAIVSACGGSSGSDSMTRCRRRGLGRGFVGKPVNAVAAPAGITVNKVDSRLQRATGPVDVWVTMDAPSMAAQQADAGQLGRRREGHTALVVVEQVGARRAHGEIPQRAEGAAIEGGARSRQPRCRRIGPRACRTQCDRSPRRCFPARADRTDPRRRQGAAGDQLRNDAL